VWQRSRSARLRRRRCGLRLRCSLRLPGRSGGTELRRRRRCGSLRRRRCGLRLGRGRCGSRRGPRRRARCGTRCRRRRRAWCGARRGRRRRARCGTRCGRRRRARCGTRCGRRGRARCGKRCGRSRRARCASSCVATRRRGLGFRLECGDGAQIVRFSGRSQGARIDVARLDEERVGLVFGREGAEAQAIARTPVLGALYLIHMGGGCELGELLRRLSDRRGGGAQIDHEGSRASEPRRFLQRLEQVLDA
jgi:hypothetical protein